MSMNFSFTHEILVWVDWETFWIGWLRAACEVLTLIKYLLFSSDGNGGGK